MAYETTSVPVERTQEAIRKLVMANKGTGVAFLSQPPEEGFEAQVAIDAKTYHVRIMATCKPAPKHASATEQEAHFAQERRRTWRVIYYHLKSVYESSASGVMEFRKLMLPYVVMPDNRTVAEHIMPKLDAALAGNPSRLLGGAVDS